MSGKKHYNLLSISRRDLLCFLTAGTVSCYAGSNQWAGQLDEIFKIKLPVNIDPENPTLAVFMALSQLITLREELDLATTKNIYHLICDEPWGKYHISSSYKILSAALLEYGRNKKAFNYSTYAIQLDEGQKWFVFHLLTTWYLGVYYHEGRSTNRVTYGGSLMFDAVKNSYPAPVINSSAYGAWKYAKKKGGKS